MPNQEIALKHHARPVLLLALLLVASAALAAKDPNDSEGSADHPEIARFPGFHIDYSKKTDYDEVQLATEDPDDSGEPNGAVKAGKHWTINYCLNEDGRQPSAIELLRNYENAFRKSGGVLVKRHPRQGTPTGAVYRMPRTGDGERWMQLEVFNDATCYLLNIVDVGAMAQKIEFSAGEMARTIKKDGYIALNGIQFDTGKAAIKSESTPLLDQVVALLRSERALRLSVEGHTDNVGDKRANLLLSKQRAESVVKYLTAKGIDGKRLKSDGKGDTLPVADNRSDAGRAKNRRVELVRF